MNNDLATVYFLRDTLRGVRLLAEIEAEESAAWAKALVLIDRALEIADAEPSAPPDAQAGPMAWLVQTDGEECEYQVFANRHEADSEADGRDIDAQPLYLAPQPAIPVAEPARLAVLRESLDDLDAAEFANPLGDTEPSC